MPVSNIFLETLEKVMAFPDSRRVFLIKICDYVDFWKVGPSKKSIFIPSLIIDIITSSRDIH